jgi:hypothetical protein
MRLFGKVWLLMALIAAGGASMLTAVSAQPNELNLPVSVVDPVFWKGKAVIQTRGFVLDIGDEDHVVRQRYWRLGESAVGRVVSVHQLESSCDVEFATAAGWEQRGFAAREVRAEEWEVEKDQYGMPVRVRKSEFVIEGVQVERGDHGVLKMVNKDDSRLVRFPTNCLGLPVPRLGDKVTAGPDFPQRDPIFIQGDIGRVITVRDADHYIGVEWERTGIKRKYRYDHRRCYDILRVDP